MTRCPALHTEASESEKIVIQTSVPRLQDFLDKLNYLACTANKQIANYIICIDYLIYDYLGSEPLAPALGGRI